ncbi:MAG: c-type cytochrome [Chthonomonadaceae bacterium]|nr:c-type cytochrome [Chthonomonadaceae bacterium]
MKQFVLWFAVLASAVAIAQGPAQQAHESEVYSTATCVGCHGVTAMGGLGPPLATTKLTYEEFLDTVRKGKGMMPATPATELPDADVKALHDEVQKMPWIESQIPLSYTVGRMLSTHSVTHLFLAVFLFAFIFGVRVLVYWLGCAGWKNLSPYVKKFGRLRATGIALRSLVVDGLCVASLFRKNRFRWFMHGLILYGFLGLMLADILMQIFNPTRGDLSLLDPLKILPIVSGIAVMTGVFYVMFRYRTDPYIDNGLTLGRDFLFVNLLFHTVVSGFLTVIINRSGQSGWVMPVYLYHLGSITLLIATAPFTRFAHAWVVPALVAMTRVTEAVTASGVNLGFEREPAPGRHHKSERIALGVLKAIDPDYEGPTTLRYYP